MQFRRILIVICITTICLIVLLLTTANGVYATRDSFYRPIEIGPPRLTDISNPSSPSSFPLTDTFTTVITSSVQTEYLSQTNWLPAVPAWIHPQWPGLEDAIWIWKSYRVTPVEAQNGSEIITFRRTFDLPSMAENIVGIIQLTADNAYELSLNGEVIGHDGILHVSGTDYGWRSIETYALQPLPGANELLIRTINYRGGENSNADSNPAGILFRAHITYNITPYETRLEPVIFIPGIAGSYLVEDGEELWPAIGLFRDQKHRRLTLDPNQAQSDVVATDAIRRVAIKNVYQPLLDALFSTGGYQEYQVNGDPSRRTEAGCDYANQQANHPTLFVFAYDWRQDNAVSAAALTEYFKCIRKFHPEGKINIVAHSMGGLVARRYILDHPETHGIDKLVTIGTPWLGAPKAINTMYTGEFANWFVASSSVLRELVVFFPGAHQLIPGEGYFALGGRPFGEADWDVNENLQNDTVYSFVQMVELLDRQFATSIPGTTTANFHTSAQDNLLDDLNDAEYHFIFGAGSRNDTIEQVIATSQIRCYGRVASRRSCRPFYYYDVKLGRGDGTVPRLSAERIGNGLNYSGVASLHRVAGGGQEHLGLTQNAEVQSLILQLLENRDYLKADTLVQASTEPPLESAYYVRIYGAGLPVVTDSLGNSTAPISETVFLENVSGLTMHVLDEDATLLVLSKNQAYTVTFVAASEPIQIEIAEGTNLTSTRAIRYFDLVLPAGANAGFQVTPEDIEPLYFDSDQSGTLDTIVMPTVDVSGALASDVLPPTVSITHTQDGAQVTVSISATDENEVATIYYSLDGVEFEIYSTPLAVEVGEVMLVHAFADDRASNRSQLAVHALPTTVQPTFTNLYLPLVQR